MSFQKNLLWASLFSGLILSSGCNNNDNEPAVETTISMQQLGTYASGVFDESAAEIVAFDANTKQTFVVNANSGQIDVLNSSDVSNPTKNLSINLAQTLQDNGIVGSTDLVGAANSVAVKNGLMAVAVEAETKTDNGWVMFYKVSDLSFVSALEVGALPDMLTFSPNGELLVVANEGEPSEDTYAIDPEGSISIIDINWDGNSLSTDVTALGFTDISIPEGVLLNGYNATPAQDLEPEYVAISEDSTRAFVALQENNAIVDVDLITKTINKIFALGLKDHSIDGNGLDGNNKDDMVNIKTENALGMLMPDSIATYQVDGVNYVLTANEGDSRDDWLLALDQANCEAGGFYINKEEDPGEQCIDEITLKDALDSDVYQPTSAAATLNLSRFADGGDLSDTVNRLKFSHSLTLKHGDLDGDGTIDKILSFGGRSFSIFNAETGERVFDSGDAFEQITAEKYGTDFNNDNAENAAEDRSDNKGPEPEALEIAQIGDKTYAFIGLERMGGIMVYDITTPSEATFIEYNSNRLTDVTNDVLEAGGAGDLGPEGMKFVSAENSPNGQPLLIVASEVSGTTTFYQINEIEVD